MGKKNIVISFNRPPFGSIFYTEGLRAAVGCTAGIDEHEVTMVYLGDGIYFTLKDVDRTDCNKYISTLSSTGAKFYAESESLEERGIKKDLVADDIKIIPRSKILNLFKDADHNIDF